MSELTITALRFGFLLLLWVLIFSIVAAMRRDLMIGSKAAAGAPTARQAFRRVWPAGRVWRGRRSFRSVT